MMWGYGRRTVDALLVEARRGASAIAAGVGRDLRSAGTLVMVVRWGACNARRKCVMHTSPPTWPSQPPPPPLRSTLVHVRPAHLTLYVTNLVPLAAAAIVAAMVAICRR